MSDLPDLWEPADSEWAASAEAALVAVALPGDDLPDPSTGDAPRDRWPGIRSDDEADWAFARLTEVDEQIDQIHAYVEAVKARADRFLHERLEQRHGSWPSLTERHAFFTEHLAFYGRTQRAEKDRKTVAVIGGTVSTRTTKATLTITDDDDLTEWARGVQPDMVRTRHDVQTTTLRQFVQVEYDDDGVAMWWLVASPGDDDNAPARILLDDMPPGVAVEPEHVTATVRPNLRELGI